MSRIKRAIFSVSDKAGIEDFAKALHTMGVEILSTGGTARRLSEAGVPVIEVSEYTGFPEMMDGRVKTLHPKIYGGLLARRDNPDHMQQLDAQGMETIDMVVVNLYPFEKTVAKPGVTFDDAIENIDIGGPTMIRAAAKNFESVAVVVDPSDYQTVMEELTRLNGDISYKTRLNLARKVYDHTSRYDSLITSFLAERVEE